MPVDSRQRAAERWFLDHGLPSVVTRRARVRALWRRSAPALAGFAVLVTVPLVIFLMTGHAAVNIDGQPTTVEWIVIVLLLLTPPLATLVGWLVARLESDRAKSVVSTASVLVGAAAAAIQWSVEPLAATAIAVVVSLLLTATGFGSVLGWALRKTASQLAAAGELLIGALPVVLLTVLVFFNTYVWLMAAAISRGRLWLAIG